MHIMLDLNKQVKFVLGLLFVANCEFAGRLDGLYAQSVSQTENIVAGECEQDSNCSESYFSGMVWLEYSYTLTGDRDYIFKPTYFVCVDSLKTGLVNYSNGVLFFPRQVASWFLDIGALFKSCNIPYPNHSVPEDTVYSMIKSSNSIRLIKSKCIFIGDSCEQVDFEYRLFYIKGKVVNLGKGKIRLRNTDDTYYDQDSEDSEIIYKETPVLFLVRLDLIEPVR